MPQLLEGELLLSNATTMCYSRKIVKPIARKVKITEYVYMSTSDCYRAYYHPGHELCQGGFLGLG